MLSTSSSGAVAAAVLSSSMTKIWVFFLFSCCISCSGGEECFTPPSPFYADVRNEDGRSILPPSETEAINLYYFDASDRKINVDFQLEGILVSGELPFISTGGVTSFYLELDNVVDTLVVELLEDQRLANGCGYFYNYVGFNGKPAELDTTGRQGVYILTRE